MKYLATANDETYTKWLDGLVADYIKGGVLTKEAEQTFRNLVFRQRVREQETLAKAEAKREMRAIKRRAIGGCV